MAANKRSWQHAHVATDTHWVSLLETSYDARVCEQALPRVLSVMQSQLLPYIGSWKLISAVICALPCCRSHSCRLIVVVRSYCAAQHLSLQPRANTSVSAVTDIGCCCSSEIVTAATAQ